MLIGIPKESFPGEQRVALTPETAGHIKKLGYDIALEAGAGEAANFSDESYRCLLYTSPSPRDATLSRMPSSA